MSSGENKPACLWNFLRLYNWRTDLYFACHKLNDMHMLTKGGHKIMYGPNMGYFVRKSG